MRGGKSAQAAAICRLLPARCNVSAQPSPHGKHGAGEQRSTQSRTRTGPCDVTCDAAAAAAGSALSPKLWGNLRVGSRQLSRRRGYSLNFDLFDFIIYLFIIILF